MDTESIVKEKTSDKLAQDVIATIPFGSNQKSIPSSLTDKLTKLTPEELFKHVIDIFDSHPDGRTELDLVDGCISKTIKENIGTQEKFCVTLDPGPKVRSQNLAIFKVELLGEIYTFRAGIASNTGNVGKSKYVFYVQHIDGSNWKRFFVYNYMKVRETGAGDSSHKEKEKRSRDEPEKNRQVEQLKKSKLRELVAENNDEVVPMDLGEEIVPAENLDEEVSDFGIGAMVTEAVSREVKRLQKEKEEAVFKISGEFDGRNTAMRIERDEAQRQSLNLQKEIETVKEELNLTALKLAVAKKEADFATTKCQLLEQTVKSAPPSAEPIESHPQYQKLQEEFRNHREYFDSIVSKLANANIEKKELTTLYARLQKEYKALEIELQNQKDLSYAKEHNWNLAFNKLKLEYDNFKTEFEKVKLSLESDGHQLQSAVKHFREQNQDLQVTLEKLQAEKAQADVELEQLRQRPVQNIDDAALAKYINDDQNGVHAEARAMLYTEIKEKLKDQIGLQAYLDIINENLLIRETIMGEMAQQLRCQRAHVIESDEEMRL